MKHLKGKGAKFWCIVGFDAVAMPIYGLVSFILHAISTVKNVNSFKDRPDYIYGYLPPNALNETNISSDTNCTYVPSGDEASFLNNLSTSYEVGMFVLYFMLCIVTLIVGNTRRIFRRFIMNPRTLWLMAVAVTFCDYTTLVLSAPAFYSAKIHYSDCIELDGPLKGFIGMQAFVMINLGVWILTLFFCYCIIREKAKLVIYERNKYVLCLLICAFFYSAGYLLFSISMKYVLIISFQIYWDIYLCIDITLALIPYICFGKKISSVVPLNDAIQLANRKK